MQHLSNIVHKLDHERLIKAHLRADTLNNSLRCVVAHGSDNRIDRHYATDHESNNHKPEQRDQHAAQDTGQVLEAFLHALAIPV